MIIEIMIVFISTSAILTVLATGLQFVGLFLPSWWRTTLGSEQDGYYYYGLWKFPSRAESCQNGHCTDLEITRFIREKHNITPTWLVITRMFEVFGAGMGIIIIAIMLTWLVLLGPMRTKHLVTARKLGLVSSFLQIITGISINIGILILVIETSPSDILTGTFLSGVSFIIFCISGAISYHSVKRMPTSYDDEPSQPDSSLSIISPPAYCDPPPSYEEIMGAHYMADNPAMVVDADMSPAITKRPERDANFVTPSPPPPPPYP